MQKSAQHSKVSKHGYRAAAHTIQKNKAASHETPKIQFNFSSPIGIQTNLSIGKPNDRFEKEADVMADTVVSNSPQIPQQFNAKQGSRKVQKKPGEEEDISVSEENHEEVSPMEDHGFFNRSQDEEHAIIRRAEEDETEVENEEVSEHANINVQASADHQILSGGSLSHLIAEQRGRAPPMAPTIRNFMEARFGADFSQVRIHNDGLAHRMTRAIGAQAFTYGRDVYFAKNKYQPGSQAGNWLIAHELTHTIQQGAARHIQRSCSGCSSREQLRLHPSRAGPNIIQRNEDGEISPEAAVDILDNPNQTVPGQVSFDEVVSPEELDTTRDPNVDNTISEGDGSFSCPDLVTPIADWASQPSSIVPSDQRLPALAIPYLPIDFYPLGGIAGSLLAHFWDNLPIAVKEAAINALITVAISRIQGMRETFPTDRYTKVALVAFLTRLQSGITGQRKIEIANTFVDILAGRSLSFMWGVLKGFLVGFFADGLLGIIQMIIDIVCLIPQFFAFLERVLQFIQTFPEAILQAYQQLLELKQRVQDAVNSAINDLMDLYRHPERIREFMESLDRRISDTARDFGSRAADQMIAAMNVPPERMGFTIGRVLGVILFEVVMLIISAVLTFYIGGAGAVGSAGVSAAKSAVRGFVVFLRRAIAYLARYIQPIIRFVSTKLNMIKGLVIDICRFLSRAWRGVGRAFGRFIDRLKGLFRRFLTMLSGGRHFLEFIGRVRLAVARHNAPGARGARGVQLFGQIQRLKRQARFRRAVGRIGVKAADNRGKWIVRAAPRGLLIRIAIAEAKMHPDSRGRYARHFIDEALEDLPSDKHTDHDIEDEIRPIKDAYYFDELNARYNDSEDEFEVMGRMSPLTKYGGVKADYPDGDTNNPIPIFWYGETADYPTVVNNSVAGDTAKSIGDRLPFPNARTSPRSIRVTRSNYAMDNRCFRVRQGGRPPENKKAKIGRRLRRDLPSGGREFDVLWNGSPITDFAIDHVKDLNLAGRDVYTNLWPAKSSVNEKFNATQYQRVLYYDKRRDDIEIDAVRTLTGKKFWVYSERAARSLSSSGGRSRPPSNRGGPGFAPKRRPAGVSCKLKVGGINDRYEQEADRMSEKVVGNSVQAKYTSEVGIQRKCSGCETEEKLSRYPEGVQANFFDRSDDSLIQTKSENLRHTRESDGLEQNIQSRRGGGKQMPDGVAGQMSTSFDTDFTNVNIHTDHQSEEMNEQLGARAFTVGNDIFFNKGQYNPHSPDGKKLLAHELTHTIQQGAGKPKEKQQDEDPIDTRQHENQKQEPTESAARSEKDKTGTTVSAPKSSAAAPHPVAEKKESPGPGVEEGAGGAGGAGGVVTAGPEPKIEPTDKLAFTGSSEARYEQFATATPSQMAASFGGLGNSVNKRLTKEQRQTADSVPQLVARLGGERDMKPQKPGDVKETSGDIQDGVTQPEPRKEQAQIYKIDKKPINKEENPPAVKASLWDRIRKWFSGFLGRIRTSDSSVNTSAGKRPKVKLTGRADLSRMQKQRKEGGSKLKLQEDATTAYIRNNPGKKRINPRELESQQAVTVNRQITNRVQSEPKDAMEEYSGLSLPKSVREATDAKLAPKINQSLLAQRQEVKSNAQKRDSDKKREISKAKKDTDDKNKEGATAQRLIVMNSRKEVGTHQDNGLKAAKETLKKYDKEANDKQKQHAKIIREKIAVAEKSIDSKYADVEKKAKEKKKEAERKAREKRAEAKRKSKKRSWWGRFKGAIRSVVKKITKFIDKVFNKLKAWIKEKIEAVRKWAVEKIEQARKWAIGKLEEFRTWAKKKVNKWLKDYPALRKKVNFLIDYTVDTAKEKVNQVADKLKRGVNAVAKALTKALNWVLSKFQTFLKGAVRFTGALLQGDLAEAAKIAFMTACELAGIDPEPILNWMNRAGSAVGKIFRSVKKFFHNVGASMNLGIKQFKAKIKKHLIQGAVGWLTGDAFRGTAITIPASITPKSMFVLAMEILGLSFATFKQRLFVKLGPGAEKAMDMILKTFTFVKKFNEKGISGIVDEFKDKLTDFKEMALSSIKSWIITKLVTEGFKFILSMLNPVGALFKIVQLLYRFVRFFIDRWSQIVIFAKSVWNSVKEIANGNIAKAANAVESALAKSVPVIIGLLFSLSGLSGIVKHIRGILKKIKDKVIAVMDKIIDRIHKWFKGLVKKGKSKVKDIKKKIFMWWKKRKAFKTKDGKEHELFFRSRKLVVASAPVLNVLKVINDNNLTKARTTFNEITSLTKTAKGKDMKDTKQAKISSQLDTKMKTLTDLLIAAGVLDQTDPPPTKVSWKMNKGRAKKVVAMPLTRHAGNTAGSSTSSATRIGGDDILGRWLQKTTSVRTIKSGGKKVKKNVESLSSVHRTHLLAADLHGPAAQWNLAHSDVSANINMEKKPESMAGKLIETGSGKKGSKKYKPNQLKYETTVNFHSDQKPGKRALLSNPQPVPNTTEIKRWLGFYFARLLSVRIEHYNHEKKTYSPIKGSPFTYSSSIPPVTTEPQVSSKESAIRKVLEQAKHVLLSKAKKKKDYQTGITRAALRAMLNVDNNSLTAALKRLENQGLINRPRGKGILVTTKLLPTL